jgi:hypothetical protein
MMHKLLTSVALTVAALAVVPSQARAVFPWRYESVSTPYDWHAGYVDPQWATPHALVVPPTACREITYQWGVGSAEQRRIRPTYHGVAGVGSGGYAAYGGAFRPAPIHPTHTDQLGTYYVRFPRCRY